MREIRPSGSEGGGAVRLSLPLSDVQILTSQFALGSAAQRDDRHAQRSVTAGKACLLTS
jgi:hypothetical protein